MRDLIVYELMVHEFAWDLEGARQKLGYLRDLGVNCVELMPVAEANLEGVVPHQPVPLRVPSNYGRVWCGQAP